MQKHGGSGYQLASLQRVPMPTAFGVAGSGLMWVGRRLLSPLSSSALGKNLRDRFAIFAFQRNECRSRCSQVHQINNSTRTVFGGSVSAQRVGYESAFNNVAC